MSSYTFKLPDIGEGIAEAEIVAWHVKVGDRVAEDQRLADMMTDKATVEIESPVAGVVKALAGEAGQMVPIGAMLVKLEIEGAAPAALGHYGFPVRIERRERVQRVHDGRREHVGVLFGDAATNVERGTRSRDSRVRHGAHRVTANAAA